MAEFFYTMFSIFAVSLISFVGVFTMPLKPETMGRAMNLAVAFATGSLLGAAFFDVLPEAFKGGGDSMLTYVFLGMMMFFVLERYIHWNHCHAASCEKHYHPMTYLNIIGGAFHNFVDGAVIAASFLVSIPLGVVTTFAIITHEIPQEMGDFAILIKGGFTRRNAQLFNFLSALTAFLGAGITYLFSKEIENMIPMILSIAGGGFIYLATADLIPEIHKETESKNVIMQSLAFVFGISIIIVMRMVFPE